MEKTLRQEFEDEIKLNDNKWILGTHRDYIEWLEDKLKPKSKNFKKPTITEIVNYCKERANNIEAERFYNHYESNGWFVGKTKMKDWKASIRTWEKNNNGNTNNTSNGNSAKGFSNSKVSARSYYATKDRDREFARNNKDGDSTIDIEAIVT